MAGFTSTVSQTRYDNLQHQANPLTIAGTSNMSVPVINWSGGDRYSLTNLGQAKHRIPFVPLRMAFKIQVGKGKHTLKVGAEYRIYKLNYIWQPDAGTFNFTANQTGLPGLTQYTGKPVASFLLGAVDNAKIGITTPTLATYRSLGLLVQDDFRVSPKLTLNIAFLGWDYDPTQTEQSIAIQFQPDHDGPTNRFAWSAHPYWELLPFATRDSGFESRHYRIRTALWLCLQVTTEDSDSRCLRCLFR